MVKHDGKIVIDLPERTQKPRRQGLTCLTDTGLTVAQTRDMLVDFGDYIDVAKFGIGSAYLTSRLDEKIKLYQDAGVIVYFGGTLFEKFYFQNKLDDYFDYMRKFNVRHVEVSAGTIQLSVADSLKVIEKCAGEFTCFCEVGTKDKTAIMPPSKWIETMLAFLDVGAEYVIAEGRDNGTAGIFRPSGELRMGLIADLISSVGHEKLIFEAPTQSSQMYFINEIGPNVNLGNIKPSDVLVLETQRNGLRYETFHI